MQRSSTRLRGGPQIGIADESSFRDSGVLHALILLIDRAHLRYKKRGSHPPENRRPGWREIAISLGLT
jgi:hypothetical protein